MSVKMKTALNEVHKELGAKMVDFAGWEMPVSYSGTLEEHNNVREKAGIFDVSHMGEIEIRGENALKQVQYITCNDASTLNEGQAQYTSMLTPEGTFIDDLLVHKISTTRYMMCVNSDNKDKDYQWILDNKVNKAEILDKSPEYTQLALQGPASKDILQELVNINPSELGHYHFVLGKICGIESIIARTGYTGEDGFELYFNPDHAEKVWNSILDKGESYGILPAGLGARDTLRLESGLCLYGNDIDDQTTPLEADLAWIVAFDKNNFIGKDALIEQKDEGISRKLIGFELLEKGGIPRKGYPIFKNGDKIGKVTSGNYAPYLEKQIGMGYIPVNLGSPDTRIKIKIRNRKIETKIVNKPFYNRK